MVQGEPRHHRRQSVELLLSGVRPGDEPVNHRQPDDLVVPLQFALVGVVVYLHQNEELFMGDFEVGDEEDHRLPAEDVHWDTVLRGEVNEGEVVLGVDHRLEDLHVVYVGQSEEIHQVVVGLGLSLDV